MNTWEYKTICLAYNDKTEVYELVDEDDPPSGDVDAILNHYGDDGWEIITIMADSFYLKLVNNTHHYALRESSAGIIDGPITETGFRVFFKRQSST